MLIVHEERNALLKRFGSQALIRVNDNLYSVESLSPSAENKRLFSVHSEAVERLNSTMRRHIDGNSQIFVTMVYKDEDRAELIKRFWNGLIELDEFKKLPFELQRLELEQAQKLGPTSRFSIEKLYDGFISHIDEESKVVNIRLAEWKEAFRYFTDYIAESILIAKREYPDEVNKFFDNFYKIQNAMDNLNKDKVGGDPYFINVGRDIAGVKANDLYFKESSKVAKSLDKEVYYTMYVRTQNKGNNIIPKEIAAVDSIPEDPWLPEKNRVVQGDSRSWQFLLKNMSDIITQVPKLVDPMFIGWDEQDRKNVVIGNFMKEFSGRYLFDSFDATEFDASTDPNNFALGIRALYTILEKVGLRPNDLVSLELTTKHFLKDATLTPWGAFERDSTPSGHNFTGPVGTLTNLMRLYIQTKRLFKVSYKEFNKILRDYAAREICLFAAVGDDAIGLRSLESTLETVAEENNSDGFKQGDLTKLLISGKFLHFLQFGYYYTPEFSLMGYYPICRVAEHCLFQEKADQYTAESVSTQAIVQNLNNARFNPCQDYAIDFFMEGDKKYRLGSEMGVLNLFKLAANGRSVAETLGREWDPQYSRMSWERFGEVISGTVKKIESRRELSKGNCYATFTLASQ